MSREENYVQDAGDRELLQPYCNLYWIEFTDSKKKKKKMMLEGSVQEQGQGVGSCMQMAAS